MSYRKQKKEIIRWAKTLNQKGLVAARSGNVSCRVATEKVLITSHDSYLGYLEEEELLLVDLEGKVLEGKLDITSEKELHLSVYSKFKEAGVVLHTHSPFSTAFFHYFDKLDIFSFEAKFYLGGLKIIPQETPTVTDIKPVLAALESSNIIVLKNHGVISVGKNFKEALSLIELLEEQAKVNITIRGSGFSAKPSGPNPDSKIINSGQRVKMLSSEHSKRLAELVNSDKEVQELGKKYDLTCTLAVKNQENGDVIRFHYESGKIIKVDSNENADFVIIGKEEILKKVFNREVDPFVASTQGKVKTKGDFAKMSRWYPVLVKTFKLWEQAPVE